MSPIATRSRRWLPLLSCAALLVLSCGQKDPTFRPPDVITLLQGDVVVTTSVPGAAISLDGLPTGKSTPDTLRDIRSGGHRVSVYRGGYYAETDSITVLPKAVQVVHFDLRVIPGETGDLAVTAPWPADILLDGTATGQTAPATLVGIEPRDHTVVLRLQGFRPEPSSATVTVVAREVASVAFDLVAPKHILCEDFSNYDCVPCPPVDAALQRVIGRTNLSQPGRLVSLNSHLYWPSNADPMFRFNPAANCSRKWTYGVNGMPAVYVDGALVQDPNDANIDAVVQARSMATAPIAVGVTGQVSAGNYHITVDLWGVQAGFASPLQLTTCVVERHVTLEPPGPNGQARYFNVLRAIIPAPAATCPTGAAGGTSISLSAGQRQSFQFDYPVPGGVDPAQLAVIALVQDLGSKEVIQTGYTFEPTTAPAAGPRRALRVTWTGAGARVSFRSARKAAFEPLGSPDRSGRPVTR